MKKTTEVIPKTQNTVPAVLDYGADTGVGFENQTRDDITIPFLTVLQALSPQITSMQDAKPGMLFNTVTEELFDGKTGIILVPATTRHVYVEWVPREKGGGFFGVHEVNSDVVKQARANSKEFNKLTTPSGNQLTETFYLYAVVLDKNDEPLNPVTLAFTSTKISVYKRWNTKVNMFTIKSPSGAKIRPPLFAHKVRVTAVKEKNNKGEFYNFDLQPANGGVADSLLPPGHPALEAAKEFRQLVESGAARADYESSHPSSQEDTPQWA